MSWINRWFKLPNFKEAVNEVFDKSDEDEFDDEEMEIELDLEDDEEKEKSADDVLAVVYFTLNRAGSIDISTQWVEIPDKSKLYAKLFHSIHNGETKMAHIKFFDDYIIENPDSYTFLQKVVNDWSRLEKEDKPIVQPHNALKVQGPSMGDFE